MTSPFMRFLAVGGLAAAANWGSRFAFSQWLSLAWAIGAAFVVGVTVAYVLSRRFVFEPSGRPIWAEYGRFVLVNLIALGLVEGVTLGLAEGLFPAIGFNWHTVAVAHGLGVLSPAVVSYFAHRHFTFARRPEQVRG